MVFSADGEAEKTIPFAGDRTGKEGARSDADGRADFQQPSD
jgi:hypothetical protein